MAWNQGSRRIGEVHIGILFMVRRVTIATAPATSKLFAIMQECSSMRKQVLGKKGGVCSVLFEERKGGPRKVNGTSSIREHEQG